MKKIAITFVSLLLLSTTVQSAPSVLRFEDYRTEKVGLDECEEANNEGIHMFDDSRQRSLRKFWYYDGHMYVFTYKRDLILTCKKFLPL